ncbi:acyl-protein thioesterase 1 [Lingula anatina]|uniref:palmitoyl-protein hydrolase n=1 Tax=Lingula anatina TaxID=7574 RepID=A0A1S3H5X6_LINAN|nr:acyl-protein thioesterase 1 [Lingula anatina]|eukprot:XP_013380529.1 acyl-protein thioesterase 1 [Lingula anatina]
MQPTKRSDGVIPSVKYLLIACTVLVVLVAVIWCCMGGNSPSAMATPAVVVQSSIKQTATVIFLHGLGDTGHGWSEIFARQARIPYIKYILPNAPIQPVTLNAGFKMPSWFDIRGLSPDSPEDAEGIKKAAASLEELIEAEEKAGIPSDRIVIGGFSQGGAVALYASLSHRKPLAGILGLSAWLPLHKQIPGVVSEANKNIKILQCHGTADPVVPFKWGQMTHEALKTITPNADFKQYAGVMHSSSEQEMEDVKSFLESTLPPV